MITLIILILLFYSNRKNHNDKEILVRDILIILVYIISLSVHLIKWDFSKIFAIVLLLIIVILEIHILYRYKKIERHR